MINYISELRCQACDDELSDSESVRKDDHDNYLDLCNDCVRYVETDELGDSTDD